MHAIPLFIQKPYLHDLSHSHVESCPSMDMTDIIHQGQAFWRYELQAYVYVYTRSLLAAQHMLCAGATHISSSMC